MSAKAWYIIGLLLAIAISIPLTQLYLSDLTDTGGIIQVATNTTYGMGLGGEFDLAIWKLWPILILIGLIILFIRAITKKEDQGD